MIATGLYLYIFIIITLVHILIFCLHKQIDFILIILFFSVLKNIACRLLIFSLFFYCYFFGSVQSTILLKHKKKPFKYLLCCFCWWRWWAWFGCCCSVQNSCVWTQAAFFLLNWIFFCTFFLQHVGR